MKWTTVGEINEYKGKSLNPARFPQEMFEMYSVPSFDSLHPEIVKGENIGASKQAVEKDDVLICKINPRINRVWCVEKFTEHRLIASSEWIVVRSKSYLSKYLRYYFSSARFRNLMNLQVAGIGGSLTRAQPKQVATYPVPVITMERQQDIVDVLSEMELLLENRQQVLSTLDTLVKSRFVEMFGDLPLFSSMQEVCKIITDGTHQSPKFVSTGIPFIFVSNIVNDYLTYDAEKFISEDTYNELVKRTPIEIGDVLLSTVGSYGHPAIVESNRKFLFQRHIAYLKPDHNKINSRYLHALILSDAVQRQIESKVKGIAQKTLNLSEIKSLLIPLPEMEIQNQFADFVQLADKSKFAIQHSIDTLQTLKAKLMQEYFG